MTERIQVADYNPRWPQQFERLASVIGAHLSGMAARIEHIGSTALPYLPAKPIIDVDVVIDSRLQLPEVIERPAGLGYGHSGDQGITGREVFDWERKRCAAGSQDLRP